MVDIVVEKIEDTQISYKEVVELLHLSFEERITQGLHFTCSTMSESDFINKTKGGQVFVAIDRESGILMGTATIHIYIDERGAKYGYHEYLAISPAVKHMGIGTELLNCWIIYAKDCGCQYVMSDTSIGATSSVKWHLKNGFRKVALISYGSTNYYSYVFKKQLADTDTQWQRIVHQILFLKSYIRTKIIWSPNGQYREWIKKIKEHGE